MKKVHFDPMVMRPVTTDSIPRIGNLTITPQTILNTPNVTINVPRQSTPIDHSNIQYKRYNLADESEGKPCLVNEKGRFIKASNLLPAKTNPSIISKHIQNLEIIKGKAMNEGGRNKSYLWFPYYHNDFCVKGFFSPASNSFNIPENNLIFSHTIAKLDKTEVILTNCNQSIDSDTPDGRQQSFCPDLHFTVEKLNDLSLPIADKEFLSVMSLSSAKEEKTRNLIRTIGFWKMNHSLVASQKNDSYTQYQGFG